MRLKLDNEEQMRLCSRTCHNSGIMTKHSATIDKHQAESARDCRKALRSVQPRSQIFVPIVFRSLVHPANVRPLSCEPPTRAEGSAARRLPRLTKRLRQERNVAGVTPRRF